LRVPGGRPTAALESLCRRIASADNKALPPARTVTGRPVITKATATTETKLEFPREEPGQRIRFGVDVLVWALRSVWVLFKRLPRWVRFFAYGWIAIFFLSHLTPSKHSRPPDISPAKVEKLKSISENYQGTLNKNDIIRLGSQIAKEFADDPVEVASATDGPLLAVPFTAPAGDAAAEKLADSVFAMAYGMVSISHHGQVSLTRDPLPSRELGAALERGRTSHATYVLWGTVDKINGAEVLTVKIATVADGSVVWSNTYPAAGADPTKIASEVDAKIPSLTPK
jgi:TolB-like protein